jgi:hypothetical protein
MALARNGKYQEKRRADRNEVKNFEQSVFKYGK